MKILVTGGAGYIGSIVVDPRDSNVIYVASQGPLWSGGGDRGLFKSTDGGETWAKILGGGEYTGVNEVVMDPRDSQVLYVTTHQRYRSVAALINGGPETAIHKTTDGGATWRKLAANAHIDITAGLMLEKCPFPEGERDMIVMRHEFEIEYPDRKESLSPFPFNRRTRTGQRGVIHL